VDNVDAIPASPIVATPDSTQRFASYALATPKLRRPSDAEVDGALKRMSYSDKVDAFRTAAYMAGIYLSSSETESALSEAGGDVTAALAATMDRSGVLREDRLSPGLSPASNGSSPHALRSPARSRSVERLKDMLKERRTPSVSTTSVGSLAGTETATESVRGSPHTSPRTSHSTSPDEPHRLLESPSPLSSANDRSPNSIVLAPVALQPHASAKRHTSVPPTQLRLASAELLAASTQQPEGALDTTLDLDAEQEAEQEAAQAWADKMERRMQLAAVLLIVLGMLVWAVRIRDFAASLDDVDEYGRGQGSWGDSWTGSETTGAETHPLVRLASRGKRILPAAARAASEMTIASAIEQPWLRASLSVAGFALASPELSASALRLIGIEHLTPAAAAVQSASRPLRIARHLQAVVQAVPKGSVRSAAVGPMSGGRIVAAAAAASAVTARVTAPRGQAQAIAEVVAPVAKLAARASPWTAAAASVRGGLAPAAALGRSSWHAAAPFVTPLARVVRSGGGTALRLLLEVTPPLSGVGGLAGAIIGAAAAFL